MTHVTDRLFNDQRYFVDDSKLVNLGWKQVNISLHPSLSLPHSPSKTDAALHANSCMLSSLLHCSSVGFVLLL